MFVLMHCGGIPFNGETVLRKSLGGSESAAYYLARELAQRGHKVVIFTNHQEEGVWDNVKYQYAGEPEARAGMPLGPRFDFFARYTPHDVCLIQRHPMAFCRQYGSKVNMLWLHDIGLIRNKLPVWNTLWQLDRLLTVSEFHKKQICKSWDLDPNIVSPIHNAVDDSLYEGEPLLDKEGKLTPAGKIDSESNQLSLLYQSRPERGLENLVSKDGIMEQLIKVRPDAHLYVCGYEHSVPENQEYYAGLFDRVEELPNCTNMGSLSKEELADVQRVAHALVYPTEFQEVSCISAMEAMKAGLPMITSHYAALPETCKGSGTKLIRHKKGRVSVGRFVSAIKELEPGSDQYEELWRTQLRAGKAFTWSRVADEVELIIRDCFQKAQKNPTTVLYDLVRYSDIRAAKKYIKKIPEASKDLIFHNIVDKELALYDYTDRPLREHYDEFAEFWYENEYDREQEARVPGGVRFQAMQMFLLQWQKEEPFGSGTRVLDYGCGHGAYTIPLAKLYPDWKFTGVDCCERAVEEARKWAEDEKLTNVEFQIGDLTGSSGEEPGFAQAGLSGLQDKPYDIVIATEILEHVPEPEQFLKRLGEVLRSKGWMMLTTPFGPWEELSYRKDHPWRHHLHHFERADLHELIADNPDFGIRAVHGGWGSRGELMGQYLTVFRRPEEGGLLVGEIDYERKFGLCYPLGTTSCCMIVRNGEGSLRRALDSVAPYVQHVIVGIDRDTDDRTDKVLDDFREDQKLWPVVEYFGIDSPLKQGFDSARNETIVRAVGDWVLWFDSDEECIKAEEFPKLQRQNQFLGYPLRQHHFSVDPDKVLTVDFPVRLFRNRANIQFYGVVHEHPEVGLNKGTGRNWAQQFPSFGHQGYLTEDIRRKRFQRNITLLKRDREKYPERILGKFLWVRDLAQMCGFRYEQNGGALEPCMVSWAKEGIKMYEDCLAQATDPGPLRGVMTRMLLDFHEYYSSMCMLLDEGFNVGMKLAASKLNGGIDLDQAKPVNGYFRNREQLRRFTNLLIDEGTKDFEETNF